MNKAHNAFGHTLFDNVERSPPSSQRNYTQITFDQYIAKIQQEPKLTMKKTLKHPKLNSNHKSNIHSTWNNKKQNPQTQNTKTS